ncbi:MAG: hypothetical protein JNL72_04025 [Flavipsychrobacter sp.]|nr:hypothetical protein [Flavipsychrobacter sp.]
MNRLNFVLGFLLLLAMAGCSGGGKFEGKWKELQKGQILVIQKKGESYDVFPAEKPTEFMSFKYDKDHDLLSLEREGTMVDISYVKENGHIIVKPREKQYGLPPMEFEKVK